MVHNNTELILYEIKLGENYRNAQAPWNERRYYTAALILEVSLLPNYFLLPFPIILYIFLTSSLNDWLCLKWLVFDSHSLNPNRIWSWQTCPLSCQLGNLLNSKRGRRTHENNVSQNLWKDISKIKICRTKALRGQVWNVEIN